MDISYAAYSILHSPIGILKNTDLARLQANEFLNDTVIEFCLKYVAHTIIKGF
jgi:Ulp1 family protease